MTDVQIFHRNHDISNTPLRYTPVKRYYNSHPRSLLFTQSLTLSIGLSIMFRYYLTLKSRSVGPAYAAADTYNNCCESYGGAENAGVENAGVEKAGVDFRHYFQPRFRFFSRTVGLFHHKKHPKLTSWSERLLESDLWLPTSSVGNPDTNSVDYKIWTRHNADSRLPEKMQDLVYL